MSAIDTSLAFLGAGPIIVDGRRYPAWSEEALSWAPAVAAWRRMDPALNHESFNAVVCRIRDAVGQAAVCRELTDAIFQGARVVGVDLAEQPSWSVESAL